MKRSRSVLLTHEIDQAAGRRHDRRHNLHRKQSRPLRLMPFEPSTAGRVALGVQRGGGHAPGGGSSTPSPQTSGPQK
jgi:hypothetical protein